MVGGEEWRRALAVDTSDDVHVAHRHDGIVVFYTEQAEAYVRTDTVVEVRSMR